MKVKRHKYFQMIKQHLIKIIHNNSTSLIFIKLTSIIIHKYIFTSSHIHQIPPRI